MYSVVDGLVDQENRCCAVLVVRVCGSNGVVCMLSPEYADGDGRVRGMSGMDTNDIFQIERG